MVDSYTPHPPRYTICEEGLDGAHIAARCISAPFGGLRWRSGKGNVAKLALTDALGGSRQPRAAPAAHLALSIQWRARQNPKRLEARKMEHEVLPPFGKNFAQGKTPPENGR